MSIGVVLLVIGILLAVLWSPLIGVIIAGIGLVLILTGRG